MGILEKAKNLFSGATRWASEMVGQRACMRACMMGPRAVGKTTTLTAIFHNTSESISQTQLKFIPDMDTQSKMTVCRRELEQIFENRTTVEERPSAGISATSQINLFHYEFGLKGKQTAIDLEIKDFPGEYIAGGLHTGEIDRFIKESNAIIIAIDTPHLMECGGIYNEARNQCRVICDYFENNLGADDEKLILLVPLKCEKYYFANRMGEVQEKVKAAYSPLINKVKDNKGIACAITPILTVGGVEFEDFARDGAGKLLVNPMGVPEKALYRFRGADAELKPMFCVQPLYYVLSYVTSAYDRNKSNGNPIKMLFAGIFNLFSSDIDLFKAMHDVNKYMLTDKYGYEIIQGGELLK